ncbi:hypothetical protein K469DRAFT_550295, partial [Zopfia rhizophila CBS 207.26]
NDFCTVFIDNIFIYFKNLLEYNVHVHNITSYILYFYVYAINLEKCKFYVTKIEFLEFIILREEILVNLKKLLEIYN